MNYLWHYHSSTHWVKMRQKMMILAFEVVLFRF